MLNIDIFQDVEFWRNLEKYNQDIKEVCKNYTFAQEGESYDLPNKKVSMWYDPNCYKQLLISHHYPNPIPEQFSSKWNLILYHPNYTSLFVINKLFKHIPDIAIEDEAGGMGKLIFFLNKLGFRNFHLTEKWTQLCESLFTDLMNKGSISCQLNKPDDEFKPQIINLVGWTHLTRNNIPDSVKLICVYNQDKLIQNKEGIPQFKNSGHVYIEAKDFMFLCKDIHDFTYIYCKKEYYKQFTEALKVFDVSIEKKNKLIIPQYEPIFEKERIGYELNTYMKEGGWVTEYKKTREFEDRIKEYLGVKYCYTVNNGTIAISLALLAQGIKPGDKIIVPDLTMIATANAVRLIGAIPVFVDIDKKDLCLDITKVWEERRKSNDIKGIIYVSLNGRWDITDKTTCLIDYCIQRNKVFIEDAAQSLGSYNYRGKIGTTAPVSTFSFSMPKIITTGQGGCIVTNDDDIARKIKYLRDHGRTSGGNDVHPYFGINSKFTDLQAIVGIEQLKDIEYRIKRKKEIYDLYMYYLHEKVFMFERQSCTTPWFVDIYLKNSAERTKVMNHLTNNNIQTRTIYPPIHKQKCYNLQQSFPVTEEYCDRGLWLPCSLNLTDKEIIHVSNKILEVIK